MTDGPRDSEASARERGDPPAMPRWVKLAMIVAGALLLVLVVVKVTGAGGEHGPGVHQSAGQQVHDLPTAVLSASGP